MASPAAQRKPRANAGGREDCWSEGATEALVQAWGDRYLRLNRGNLRQKDWKEVADAVNSRENGVKPQRTDIQCKNRVDTLKKKYKLEKSKPSPSAWPLYGRMDYLVGTAPPSSSNGKSTAIKLLTAKPEPNPNPNPSALIISGCSSKLNSNGSESSSLGEGGGEDDLLLGGTGKKRKLECVGLLKEASALRELARAILKFGEIYERIESSKQQQIMELEKHRMEVSKELEVQRMNMLMEAQVMLAKSIRPAKNSRAGNEAVGKAS